MWFDRQTTKQQPTEIEVLGTKQVELAAMRREKETNLRRVEMEAGERFLEADANADEQVRQIHKLQTEIAAIDRTMVLLASRRPEILRAELRAQSAAASTAARDKKNQLEALEARTRPLLEALAGLEGCAFGPLATPTSSVLRAAVDELERKAADLGSQDIPTCGSVDLEGITSDEPVFRAVMTFPALAPSMAEIAAWLATCDECAQKYRGASFGINPRRVFISWTREGIDRGQSYVFCVARAAKRRGYFADGSREAIDVESGTIRAGAYRG